MINHGSLNLSWRLFSYKAFTLILGRFLFLMGGKNAIKAELGFATILRAVVDLGYFL
jgi:hypothetical protein